MSSNHTGVLYPLRKSAAGSADRNKGPILSVVGPLLDDLYGSRPLSRKNLRILEVASGEGRQVAHIASNLPTYDFHPSEADEASCAQIDDVVASTTPPLANVQKAKVLRIEEPDNWRTATRQRPVDAVFAFNLVHIAPWEVTQCLFEMVANPEILADDGLVALYGAWNEQGQFTSDGNREVCLEPSIDNDKWLITSTSTV